MQTRFALVLCLLAACNGHRPAAAAAGAPTPALLLDGRQFEHFGLGVHGDDAFTVGDLVADAPRYLGRGVRFAGRVQAVCETRGCWLRVGDDATILVSFLDDSFFVPVDCAGREVLVEGELQQRPREGVAPAQLICVATGVALRREPRGPHSAANGSPR